MSSTTLRPTDADDELWSGGSKLRAVRESGVSLFLLFCAAVTVLTTAGIIVVLGVETVEFFRKSGVGLVDFLTGTELKPDLHPPKYGILPLVWGTFVVAAGSTIIALPVGLLSAIYLSEYAPRGLRAILKPTLELLAGIPTIVYGYLALLVVTPVLKAIFEPLGIRVETFNALSACIVVGVMIIPMVSSLSEDVLSAVPRGLREAGYGLGATKFEVSTRIVVPAALSGVVASFILALSRAIGETMAVVLAAGMRPQISLNPLTSIETMTTYIVAVTNGEASYGSPKYLSLFAVGMVLFAITLTLNIVSGLVLRRYREVYQ
ncbi:phosphate ABC transporter membrane protein 1, PhoT family [Singulisphaera sp. GP187]|uniref:phosphate ABC transporter permease subunit PstC n=1 Tax=Singulisphaera sp. GP187 TaxID=1882752 RepID=UPI00092A88BD|nr:phosphate ABC transporter permease subunit PstC [Singulisphaera sp. GP187]SIN87710.1 phosphate ABC transporter membrane protein 1, PhoT family [Singulisphaera sp. GP187]